MTRTLPPTLNPNPNPILNSTLTPILTLTLALTLTLGLQVELAQSGDEGSGSTLEELRVQLEEEPLRHAR